MILNNLKDGSRRKTTRTWY